MIFLYQIISIIFSPLIDLYLILRKFNKKEDPIRFSERFGYSKIKKPENNLFWLHCASVGESKMALTLAQFIVDKLPNINVLITSGTLTSATQIVNNLPKRTIHQYVPIDKFFTVKRFINHWQPNLAIFFESELWPNLITQAKKSGCLMILVNARISKDSFKKWKILHKIGFNVLKHFSFCFPQSQDDHSKLNALGVKNAQFIGNLKFANNKLAVNQLELEKLKQAIGQRVFWLASSTHRGEEELVISMHQKLQQYFPNLLTIIAPRHPNRIEEIINLIPKNIKIAIRSKEEDITDCQIYLADTMGEMGTFYSLSKISLICGSLIDGIGGHNPIEAIQLGSVILTGAYVQNNQQIYQDLLKDKLCIVINNQEELLFYLLKLIKDEQFYLKVLNQTKALQNNGDEILEKIIECVKKLNYLTNIKPS